MLDKVIKDKIVDGSAKLATVGLGYVGLPLSVEFAAAGLSVTGIRTVSISGMPWR